MDSYKNLEAEKPKGMYRYFKFAWDLFMVTVVLVNISLILFGLTYFWLRPFYFNFFPNSFLFKEKLLSAKYFSKDPDDANRKMSFEEAVFGMEPHRTTDYYIRFVEEYKKLLKLQDPTERNKEREEILKKMNLLLPKILSVKSSNEFQKAREDFSKTIVLEPGDLKDRNLQGIFTRLNIHIDGIIKNKDTESYYELLDNYEKYGNMGNEKGSQKELDKVLAKLDSQMIRITSENPFESSGQNHLFKEIQHIGKSRYDKVKTNKLDKELRAAIGAANPGTHIPSTAVAFHWFWKTDSINLQEKFKVFNTEIRPRLAINYFRQLDMSGKPVDRFMVLDTPFFIFFILEFLISWFHSVRRKEYIAWFLYPLYHWYDVVGLIPFAYFRIFRLVRVYTAYKILKESEFTNVGDDVVTKTIKAYSEIIKEELSDMVTIQILTEAQAEVRSGNSMEIVTDTLNNKRDEIKKVVVNKLASSASNDRVEKNTRELLSKITSTVSQKLGGLFPEKIVTEIGIAIFHSVSLTISNIVRDKNSKRAIEDLVDLIIDEINEGAKDEELNELNQSITIEFIENMKKSVAVKKWAQKHAETVET
ncbi:MAG: hypothetical protein H7A25_05075 [Leptospiraceae bacterium]|nr:hypothetical protein [Leptospiraceae bacterium]MCP5499251.1 hypothetical protein [Leptospiraceae bacterium]